MGDIAWIFCRLKVIIKHFLQTNLIACCANDRSTMLYDMRGTTPLKKVSKDLNF